MMRHVGLHLFLLALCVALVAFLLSLPLLH